MADAGDRRPSPDALLELARKEGRGRLKIFLGASPGVGKTYAMLSAAQRLRAEGRDVVVGVVETHGRPETAALLAGLEVLPRRVVDYRGHVLMEFDLDAALARRPDLVIVDELAHTNAPESRHPKRYQDVEELLAAGINVWTALNIQHLESLSDVVAAITGVKVRERVPDTVLEASDDVVVVDITPDELIERLKNGKVYLPENARRAADNFLKPGNLTALRELALRRTAERVDDQMVDYLRRNAIEGPWPAAERVLVCVGDDQLSEKVVRVAARIASTLNADWLAVHVARPQERAGPVQIDEVMALATRLGADVRRVTGSDIAGELLRLAAQENITQIVIGHAGNGGWSRLFRRPLPDDLVRRASGVSVHVITGENSARKSVRQEFSARSWPLGLTTQGFAAAGGAVVLAGLASKALVHFLKLPNLSMIFLTAVLFCAVTYGTASAVVAAALSFLAYNFFFIEPLYTLTVASPHEFLALVMFLLVAVLTGSLAGRVRAQSDAALARVRQIEALYDLSHKLSATTKLDDVIWIIATRVAATVRGQSIVLLPEKGEVAIVAAMPPEDTLGAADWTAARWAFAHGEAAGWKSTTLPNARFQYRPLRAAGATVGVVGVRPEGDVLSEESVRMLEALLNQFAVAIERIRLGDEATEARTNAETERLRSALLSSLSHDLRTPLSSILGSVTTLRALGSKLRKPARDDLLATIEEEATRLSRFVSNLLDMTKIESGALAGGGHTFDLVDVVAAAVRRGRATWPGRRIDFASPAQSIAARGDAALVEQLVFNLLDNAHKYSPPGSPIHVSLYSAGTEAKLIVEDEGLGIPPEDLERVFEKFYRVKAGDGRPPGTGLGLAICRGIATSMGGNVAAESPVRDGRGTRLVVRLPAEATS
ncbi:MAG: sensor histidine kinase KdpD [Hyphomicrobiales bacterium]